MKVEDIGWVHANDFGCLNWRNCFSTTRHIQRRNIVLGRKWLEDIDCNSVITNIRRSYYTTYLLRLKIEVRSSKKVECSRAQQFFTCWQLYEISIKNRLSSMHHQNVRNDSCQKPPPMKTKNEKKRLSLDRGSVRSGGGARRIIPTYVAIGI